MTVRPKFNKSMTSETFSSFYWYKGEFKNISPVYNSSATP